MATPPVVDIVTIASAATGVAPSDLAAAIATLQAAAAASCEGTVGVIAAVGAPIGTAATRHHPSVDPPSVTAGASASAGPTAGAAGSLAATATVGTPAGTAAGTIAGHPPTGLLFLAAGMSTLAGPVTGVARPLDAAIVGTPTGTVVGAAGP
jgi:hypothetical protein